MPSAGSVQSCVDRLLREQGEPVVLCAHVSRQDRPTIVQLQSDPIPMNYRVVKLYKPEKPASTNPHQAR